MDEYIEGLFSKEAFEQPSDTKKPDDLEMRIPEWFDEDKFNKLVFILVILILHCHYLVR